MHYSNRTGRNDFVTLKVARDQTAVAFYAETREPITPCTDPNWMWLLIGTDAAAGGGWEGYTFIVNRSVEGDGSTWLEQSEGGWNWRKIARVEFRVVGRQMHLVIPRAALGLPSGTTKLTLDVKWIDNAQKPGDIMDTYVSGDAAPAAGSLSLRSGVARRSRAPIPVERRLGRRRARSRPAASSVGVSACWRARLGRAFRQSRDVRERTPRRRARSRPTVSPFAWTAGRRSFPFPVAGAFSETTGQSRSSCVS